MGEANCGVGVDWGERVPVVKFKVLPNSPHALRRSHDYYCVPDVQVPN